MKKELKIVTGFKKLKSDLSGMTYQEKLTHLWTYYKWFLLVILGVILATSILISCVKNLSVEVLMGGVTLNVDISDEGEAYLKSGYKAHIGSTSEKERVSFAYHSLQDPMKPGVSVAENSQNLEILMALCANHQIDYLIANREAWEILLNHDACADLSTIYSAEELAAMEDKLVYYQPADSAKKIPVAINILDTAFIQDNTSETEIVYFIFVSNSNRLEQVKDLYEYLLAWPAKK